MKNILLLLGLFFCLTVQSQNIKIENGIFYTTAKNGLNQLNNIKFSIDNETIEKIKLSNDYKETLKDKDFINSVKVKNKISSILVAHLFSAVNNAVLNTGWQIKNEISLDFIENTIGEIYFNKNNELIIEFYFKSKNEIGNELTLKSQFNDNLNNVRIVN